MTDIFDARQAREIQYEKQRHYLDRYEDPSILRSRLLQAQQKIVPDKKKYDRKKNKKKERQK